MRILATFWLSGVIAFYLLLTPLSTAQHKPAPAPIVITHATVINPGTSSVQANRTIVITGDHITSVSDTAKFQSPKIARLIDATGQYLIPGLWDMHVHSAFGDWFPGGRDIILPLFIANGVTGVRDMGGDAPVLFEWRKEIADGQIIGPRMVISGPLPTGHTRRRWRGRRPTCRSAVTARRDRSCRRLLCWRRLRSQPMPRLTKRWKAICAAVAPTSAYARRFTGRRHSLPAERNTR